MSDQQKKQDRENKAINITLYLYMGFWVLVFVFVVLYFCFVETSMSGWEFVILAVAGIALHISLRNQRDIKDIMYLLGCSNRKEFNDAVSEKREEEQKARQDRWFGGPC